MFTSLSLPSNTCGGVSDKTPSPCPPHLHPVLNPLPGVQLINLCSDHCVPLIPALPPQVVLINAVRDVAKALTELIGATKCAAGKAADDPSMYQLKSAAKVKEKKKRQGVAPATDLSHQEAFICRWRLLSIPACSAWRSAAKHECDQIDFGKVGIIASDLTTELTKSQYLRKVSKYILNI